MSPLRLLHAVLVAAAFVPAALVAQAAEKKIPASFTPPPGMCRIWVDGVPADKQPAATDCSTALKNKPTNGRVVFGDSKTPSSSGGPPSMSRTLVLPPAARGFAPPPTRAGPARDSAGPRRDTSKAKRDTVVKKRPPPTS